MSYLGLNAICAAHTDEQSLYRRLWHHLWDMGLRREPVEQIRARMRGVSIDVIRDELQQRVDFIAGVNDREQ